LQRLNVILVEQSLLEHELETIKKKRSNQHEVSCYLGTLIQSKFTVDAVRFLALEKDEDAD